MGAAASKTRYKSSISYALSVHCGGRRCSAGMLRTSDSVNLREAGVETSGTGVSSRRSLSTVRLEAWRSFAKVATHVHLARAGDVCFLARANFTWRLPGRN